MRTQTIKLYVSYSRGSLLMIVCVVLMALSGFKVNSHQVEGVNNSESELLKKRIFGCMVYM